jgi:hypothetical protein
MPKAALLIALALMLLSGLVIGNLSALDPVGQRVDAIPPASSGTSRTAVSFYSAIDMLLSTGDASSLRNTVHPDFIDHSPLSPEPGNIETLEAWLLSIRASSPDLRFTVTEVIAQNDLIAVDLEQTSVPDVTIAGLPVTVPQATGGYELLRVENGLVSERWASPALPGQIDPSVASLGGIDDSGWIREPRIERLTFASQSRMEMIDHKGTVLIVESGSLNLRVAGPSDLTLTDSPDGANRSWSSADIPVRLDAGALHTIEPDAPFLIWNTGQTDARLVALTVVQLAPVDYFYSGLDDADESGVTRQLLAGGATIRPDHGPFQLQVGHAVVAPGMAIAPHKVNELEMLFVTKGTVEATLENGWVFSLSDLNGLKTENDVATVGPDQAISAGYGVELSYQVTGSEPAEFWLITVMPEEQRQ